MRPHVPSRLGIPGEAPDPLQPGPPVDGHGHDVDLAGQAIVGPTLRVQVHAMTAQDQEPAEVGDVVSAPPRDGLTR